MARKSDPAPEIAAVAETPAAGDLVRPTLAQLEAAKRFISEELPMASPMDEHIIQIALLLALNLDAVMGGVRD